MVSTSAASCIQNPEQILFDREHMNMDKSIQQYSDGEKLEALTQTYVELGLPLQFAYWAAEADLCHDDAQKSVSRPCLPHDTAWTVAGATRAKAAISSSCGRSLPYAIRVGA
jgi:hypothetical protein